MCGIFGYVGTNNTAHKKVLNGLKILEYRGYDSWGVTAASLQNSKFIIQKSIGKIEDANLNSQFSTLDSQLSIGHTRWATHGGVTRENAHPHLDCTELISVVHNGIVENFEEIKKQLIKKGHKFKSETDTEVIPHLIEDWLKTKGFATSVRLAFNQLTGMNAIVVAYSVSSEIITAKTGSPIVIGESKDGLYVSSDASSILPNTKKLLFLEDNQMAILGKKLQLLSLPKGTKQKVKFETILWNTQAVTKGKYSHFMLKEIHEQPLIIRTIARNYRNKINLLSQTIKKAKGTFLIGAGTASYAGLLGTYFFSKIAKKHVNMSSASEFNYLLDFLTPESLIIALSQSGETIDVVEPLTIAKKKGSQIVAIVNTEGSTIFRMSNKQLLLGAGIEQAVASTKAYIAKTSILFMLAFAMKSKIDSASKQLLKTEKEISRIIKQKNKLIPISNILSKSGHIYIIGRGVSFPSALEAALKIKEVSYIHAEGLAGGELKHGAIALISKKTPCIVFAPMDETYQAIISNAIEIKSRGGIIIGIGPKKESVFDYWIEVKNCEEASAIAQTVPIQLIAYYLALKKGYDPDKPRNLAKSVTVK